MLVIDENRKNNPEICEVGIYVRAFDTQENKWKSVDISRLDKESLVEWLETYDKEVLIKIICYLLGYSEQGGAK